MCKFLHIKGKQIQVNAFDEPILCCDVFNDEIAVSSIKGPIKIYYYRKSERNVAEKTSIYFPSRFILDLSKSFQSLRFSFYRFYC